MNRKNSGRKPCFFWLPHFNHLNRHTFTLHTAKAPIRLSQFFHVFKNYNFLPAKYTHSQILPAQIFAIFKNILFLFPAPQQKIVFKKQDFLPPRYTIFRSFQKLKLFFIVFQNSNFLYQQHPAFHRFSKSDFSVWFTF